MNNSNIRILPTQKNIKLLHSQGFKVVHKPTELKALRAEQAQRRQQQCVSVEAA